MCKISFIIPCYNAEKTIERLLLSIINQKYKELEIIIIDDNSNDNSVAVINKINDSRIKLIKLKKNKGVSNARNIGIDNAIGDYIIFCDSDDYIEENIISKFNFNVEYDLQIYGYNLVDECGNKEKISISNLEIQGKERIAEYILDNFNNNLLFVSLWNKIYKKSLIKKVKFNTKIYNGEDFEFNLRYYELCNNMKINEDIGYNYCIIRNNYKLRKNSIENHTYIATRIKDYTEKYNIKNESVNYYFYNSIYYDLITLKRNRISKKEILNYMKIIKSNSLFRLKLSNRLSIKKKVFFIIFKCNYYLAYYLIK